MRVATGIVLTDDERRTLTKWSRGRSTPARVVLRARIVLAAAEGRENKTIAAELGCTRRTDITIDAQEMVHLPKFTPGEPNGLSNSPTIDSLPPGTLPEEFGGTKKNTKVWQIRQADLGPDLIAKEDSRPGGRRHISIGPLRTMSFKDFANAIVMTRSKWQLVTKGGS